MFDHISARCLEQNEDDYGAVRMPRGAFQRGSVISADGGEEWNDGSWTDESTIAQGDEYVLHCFQTLIFLFCLNSSNITPKRAQHIKQVK